MNKKQIIVTTSWDDGHKLDLKLANLLKKYNIQGTFYISPNEREFKERDLLSDKDIIGLAKDFEIGAHTMTHVRLTNLDKGEAFKEIIRSKEYLENLTKEKIKCFSYPFGNYNKKIKELIKKAGFFYARTVNPLIINYPKDNFKGGVTVGCHPPISSLRGLCGEIKFAVSFNIKIIPCLFTKDWEKRSKIAFDIVLKNGGIFHLWGHSWEVEKYHEWDKLERILDYLGNRPNVKYLTNTQMIKELAK